jgi:TRAP transporter 4TM/12TM fusion protein
MSEELELVTDISEDNKEKLEELMEQDARTARPVTGLFKGLVTALGAFMVLFYFYTAGVSPVATQFHRGAYVFVTYVLVFLLYPAGKTRIRSGLCFFLGLVLSGAAGAFLVFDSAGAFRQWLHTGFAGFSESIAVGMMDLTTLWPLVLGGVAVGLGIYIVDGKMMQRSPDNPTLSDLLLASISAGAVAYWVLEFADLNYRAGAENDLDKIISVIGVILSLEVCRRVLGWAMTMIGVAMLCYSFFGPYMPAVIEHKGFAIERLATALFLGTNGIFGVMANVLATYVILFIFFGAFLHKSGAGKFFIDFPMALAGKSVGGPAKVAVIASAIFGSVSGSAIANTVSTGAFTIPLMKRAGFKPHVAGAIEPSASIGGMFMPPIMGAGGFLMAELTETPYSHIMLIAIAPAMLYFFSVFCMIHFEAKKNNIQGMEQTEHWWVVLKREWYYSLPLVVITVLMIIGRSPGYSAFWATLSCIAISWMNKETRMGPKEIWEAILTGANNTLIIGATLGVIGIIVGTISLTGIGLKFSDIIISLASGNLFAAIFLVALASLVLGMGVPVTAAYLITAVLAVPPLQEMGVVLIAAHMIVYWFSQDSNITPPVCVAAYAGAAIAGSDPWKTGWTSFKFAKLLYVMPVLFAFTPAILFEGNPVIGPTAMNEDSVLKITQVHLEKGQEFDEGALVANIEESYWDADDELVVKSHEVYAVTGGTVDALEIYPEMNVGSGEVLLQADAKLLDVFSSIFSAILGTIAFSALTMFYFIRKTTIVEWLMLLPATILLYWPTFATDGIGLVLVAAVYFMQKRRGEEEAVTPAVATA